MANGRIQSIITYLMIIVFAGMIGYVIWNQYSTIRQLNHNLSDIEVEKAELVKIFKKNKIQWGEYKKSHDSNIESIGELVSTLLKKGSLSKTELASLNEKLKTQDVPSKVLDTSVLDKKLNTKCPTLPLSDWEFHDYQRLTLEVMHQQKMHRFLWRPQETRPIQKVVILTDLHNPKMKQDEPLIALQANLLNHFVEEIHLLVEEPDWEATIGAIKRMINKEKITTFKMTKRWTPADAFKYANDNLKGKIVIMTNNDIIFDYTLINMREFPKDQKQMWAISRRRTTFDGRRGQPPIQFIEVHPDMCWSYVGSHDGYVFVPAISQAIIDDTGDFYLGEWGCENRILYAFAHAGYGTHNPCWRFNLWHYSTAYYKKNTNRRVSHGKSAVAYPTGAEPSFGMEFGWPSGISVREQDLSGL
jgi:hypothetical protein